MKEIVFNVPSRRSLGVLSVPDHLDAAAPTVLIPNTGLEHRVGPNRVHVDICRALAGAGVPALRLDLSGMGDSSRGDRLDATADLRAAVDQLEASGFAPRVIGVGLCSGAHDLHQLARLDPRVIAAAFIDGYAYPTPLFHLNYLLQRLAEPSRVFKSLRRRFEETEADELEYFQQPDRRQMSLDMDLFLRRKVSLWYVYTGQVQHVYNYAEQFFDAFPALRGRPGVKLTHLRRCDHTFSRAVMRSSIASQIVQWVTDGLRGGFAALPG
jgi:dienelactone hydrolase